MLSNFIKQLREKNNFSQEYMASKIGISRPTYAQIELGKRDLTVIEAKIISDIFGMSLNDFLQEKKLLVDFQIKKSKNKNKKKKEDIRISIPQEKIDKFKQVLLYILEKAGGKPNVGMTVLYKLLYFIDFDYYEKNEEQLMGLVYIKNHYGPTPILFDRVIKEMNKKGEIEVLKSKFYQHPQTKYLLNPSIIPDLKILNGKEKEHIDWELQRLSNLTATALSDLSHKDVPWISAQEGRPIDYESVFYRTNDTSVRNYGEED
ncbi:MAG: hypothetical protein MCSN_4130 [Candidatus Microsyncoccus archaeolyticus]|nr:MAG: hypothetical protein MCSN_4130 [Candidatus Parcubacteria bacterium]